MRVLLLNQVFWPDRAGSARLATDLARRLGETGTEVIVVAGRTTCATEAKGAPTVRIIHAPVLLQGNSVPARVCSYGAYLVTALVYALFGPKPDIVVTLTTPPLLSLIGVAAKAVRGCRHYIWEMDLYPEVAIDVGVLRRDSVFTRSLESLAIAARRRADGVIVIGECMRQRLAGRGMDCDKLLLAENWADGELLREAPFQAVRPLTILYSGNLGRVHDIQTIAEVMVAFRDDDRIRFLFVGGGPARPALESFCQVRAMANVQFEGYRRSDALPTLLSQAHVGFVSLRSSCLGSSVPSKIYEYMAVGRPVLFVGPPQSTVAQIIDRYACGWHTEPGNTNELLRILQGLLQNPESVRRAGANAHRAFIDHYDLHQRVSHVAQLIGCQ